MGACVRCCGNCAAWTGFILSVVASVLALTSIIIPLWIYVDSVATVPVGLQADVRIYSGLWAGCYWTKSTGLDLYTCSMINTDDWWIASKIVAVIAACLTVITVIDMGLYLLSRKSFFVTCAMTTSFFAGAAMASAVGVFGYFFTWNNIISFGPVYILGRWDHLHAGYWLGVGAAPSSILAGIILIRAKWVGDTQEIEKIDADERRALESDA